MSQTFFTVLDPLETLIRLGLLGSSKGRVTIWVKGSQEKRSAQVQDFDKETSTLLLHLKDSSFTKQKKILCTFELRGMNFFSEVSPSLGLDGNVVLIFSKTIYKSERRTSYRLLAGPIYEIFAQFKLSDPLIESKVIDIKLKQSQTGLFRNFLKIVDGSADLVSDSQEKNNFLKIKIQDLSTTGMSFFVGSHELSFFKKDNIFEKVILGFSDEEITIPSVKIIYVVDYISKVKMIKKFKVGVHFENLPLSLDDLLGKKINLLMRENDSNKEFENFIK
jgi:hypothetical protein